MIKKKHLFVIGILLLFSFNLALAAGEKDYSSLFGLESGTIVGRGLDYSGGSFYFLEKDAYLKIDNEIFSNISSDGSSRVDVDDKGRIIEANLPINEKGASLSVWGVDVYLAPNSTAALTLDESLSKVITIIAGENLGTYSIDDFVFEASNGEIVTYEIKDKSLTIGQGVKVKEFGVGKTVFGEGNKFNDMFGEGFISGAMKIEDGKYYLMNGYIEYNGVEIDAPISNEPLLIAFDEEPKDRSKKYVYLGKSEMTINSVLDSSINVEFKENNPYFDSHIEDPNNPDIEKFLNINVADGDYIKIKGLYLENPPQYLNKATVDEYNQQGSSTSVPIIYHESKSNENGETIIVAGRQKFDIYGELFSETDSSLNTRNRYSPEFILKGDVLKGGVLKMYEDNGYETYDRDGRAIFTFDKSVFNDKDYKFKNEASKSIYNFAESKVAHAGFLWGGRGKVYYTEGEVEEVPAGLEAYDCIGLAQTALSKTYGGKLSDYPPDLRLVKTLRKKGWHDYIIEPGSIVSTTALKVAAIPAGSIVFLMHPSNTPGEREGIDYITYTNSKGERVYLHVGHTLIKGKDESNFINSIPTGESLFPKRLREYNKRALAVEGLITLFDGMVKEGNLVPETDYLLVMSP